MFNNAINLHDVQILLDHIRSRGPGPLLHALIGSSRTRTETAWSQVESDSSHWWSIPEIQERWNYLVSSDATVGIPQFVSAKFLAGRSDLHAVSIASGTGRKEVLWARLGIFKRIDAYDISPRRIAFATEHAQGEGVGDILHFHRKDVERLSLPTECCDLILADGALHHLRHLDALADQFARWLRPDGLLVVQDFVGPSRFQWTDRQLDAARELLRTMPERYRRERRSGRIKRTIHRPGWLSVALHDPSEAPESSRILPTLQNRFSTVMEKPLGGTILHLLFKDIAHNFLNRDPETHRLLLRCFAYEDQLMLSSGLPSDFMFIVYANRRKESL